MADCEWKEPGGGEVLSMTDSPEFIRQGYLHVTMKEEMTPSSTNQTRKFMGKRLSDTSLLSSWSRRWAVLSQLLGGTQIIFYKDHHSFQNCEAPCDVISLNDCLRLASLPTHRKSDNAFMICWENKTVYFYTDQCLERDGWMKTLQDVLHLTDSSCHSPLKGLPRQKALRKGNVSPTSKAETLGESPSVVSPTQNIHREPGLLHKASQFLSWGSYHSQPCLTTTNLHLPSTSGDKTTPKNDSVKFIGKKTLNTS